MLKDELFTKKKQYYQYERKMSLLDEKIKQYTSIIDNFDSYLSRGDIETLEERKRYIENEILLRKTMNTIS